jgi:pyruvate,water dikinase
VSGTAIELAAAARESEFGGKAVALGLAIRRGLNVPPGIALSTGFVEAVAAGNGPAAGELSALFEAFDRPVAVRSSAVGEDSERASFAGQHRTILNIDSAPELIDAVAAVWRSACADAATPYRERLGITGAPRTGVIVQALVEADTAGVLFTRDPVTDADERLIEASWGLGEAVVAGLVIPDRYRVSRAGEILERTPGVKEVTVTRRSEGGLLVQTVAGEQARQLCLEDAQLLELHQLACRCEETYQGARDLEWAFADGTLHLLQSRAVTSGTQLDRSRRTG